MGSGELIAPRSWRGACSTTWSARCESTIYSSTRIPLISFQLGQGTHRKNVYAWETKLIRILTQQYVRH